MQKLSSLTYFVLAAIALTSPTAMALVTYDVQEYTLSNGYAIDGGTITTNDARTDIVAWNIQVSGPRPYTFSDTNPGAQALIDEFDISPTEITINVSIGNSTGFQAFDNSAADCTDCRQQLIYVSSGPSVFYQVRDSSDSVPSIEGELAYDPPLTVASVRSGPVAVPALSLQGLISSAIVMVLAGVFALSRRHRRRA